MSQGKLSFAVVESKQSMTGRLEQVHTWSGENVLTLTLSRVAGWTDTAVATQGSYKNNFVSVYDMEQRTN